MKCMGACLSFFFWIFFGFLEFQKPFGGFEGPSSDAWFLNPFSGFCYESPGTSVLPARRHELDCQFSESRGSCDVLGFLLKLYVC